jgi:hypothetical protein
MATFIHLTCESLAIRIRRTGIGRLCKPSDNHPRGIFAMPVTSNLYVTHQWLRELKRRGRKPIVGVYFRISDKELVWIGRYNQLHRKMTAANATAEFWGTDPRDGWEVIIPRRIAAREICRVCSLPQVIGWRYYPGANGKLPCCGCKYCTRGEYGARRLRRRIGVSE